MVSLILEKMKMEEVSEIVKAGEERRCKTISSRELREPSKQKMA